MKNLYIGNMSFKTTETELRALMEPFGAVTRIHMAMDRETGRPRGFAFVEMATSEDAEKALAENGNEFMGRALSVSEARPPKQFDRPRGGQRPGGGGRGGHDRRRDRY